MNAIPACLRWFLGAFLSVSLLCCTRANSLEQFSRDRSRLPAERDGPTAGDQGFIERGIHSLHPRVDALLASAGKDDKSKGDSRRADSPKTPERIILLAFDGIAVPVNKEGHPYPRYYYDPQGRREGGKFTATLNENDCIAGKSLQLELTEGALYAQFNPYDGATRGFARENCPDPDKWKFNTYNRFRFWIKAPESAPPHKTNGQGNYEFGTYCKRVDGPDRYSDETGGGHFYHLLNIPSSGQWTQVLINMHPSHVRGASGGKEHGNMPHPTGEASYNYFDALTRFYIQAMNSPARHPAIYLVDEFEFYRESHAENDAQVYSLAATHIPGKNRIILTWCRDKNENTGKHEVRYAFEDIHVLGWDKAKPAPQGLVKPLGDQGYHGMVYDTTGLPLKGRREVFLAVKPQKARLFSQITVPLKQH